MPAWLHATKITTIADCIKGWVRWNDKDMANNSRTEK